MIGQLLLGLSILIGLHEAGHMLAAKAFGMRVEKFSIGFPPKIFGFKVKETEYSLGALPLGGFVKISGMIDESLDTESLRSEPQPWEFRAKPAWQRLIVMMGGIIVNIVLGVLIFIVLTYKDGDTYFPREEVLKHGIEAREYGQQIGLRTGDKILEVNGKKYERFNEVLGADVLLGENSSYTVERNGEIINVPLPPDLLEVVVDKESSRKFIDIRRPFVVGRTKDDSNAEKAGLQEGDRIVAVNGQETFYFDQFKSQIDANAGETVTLQVMRNAEQNQKPEEVRNVEEAVTLTAQVGEDSLLGFAPKWTLEFQEDKYGFGESIAKGTSRAFESVWLNIRGFGKIFSGDVNVSKAVKGPIGIREIYGGEWDWSRFWGITALLSMWLAFVNFLPIPALDGGHVMFLTYEMVSGTAPSDRFLEVAQKAGMAIILVLMALVIGNDLFNLFF